MDGVHRSITTSARVYQLAKFEDLGSVWLGRARSWSISRRLIRRGILVCVSGAITAVMWIGSVCPAAATPAVQPAPDQTGQKLSAAKAAISGAGMAPVVQTVLGDRVSQNDCLVSRQQLNYLPAQQDSIGTGSTQVLLSLNCNAGVATATTPGNSPESPAGQAALAAAAAATPAPTG
jgi:hypothetical protein